MASIGGGRPRPRTPNGWDLDRRPRGRHRNGNRPIVCRRPGYVKNYPPPQRLRGGKADNPNTALALSPAAAQAYALLFKTEGTGPTKCLRPGKPLEIKVTKNGERLWVGFNDERGHFRDNHLGRGRRHEFDPLWVRVEVVRTITD